MVSLKDVVYQSLRFEEPQVCPYYIWINDEMIEPLSEIYGAESFFGPEGGTKSFAGSYTVMTEIGSLAVSDSGDLYTDEFGTEIRRGSAMHVERPALAEPSLKGYEFPDLTSDAHFKGFDSWLSSNRERFKIVQVGMMFWERTWLMRGMENILMDFHLHPGFVVELLEGLESVATALIDRLLKDYGDQIDAIGLDEDYGTEKSLLISPETWREFIKPGLARMYERIRAGGKAVYLHSCGHVQPLIPELVEIGANMLQPLQPEANDIFEIKREFGKDLCLMGGISTQKTLPFGTVDDVKREVEACLRHMTVGGGYVMAPAKPIMPGVPLENAQALIDAFVSQRI